MHRQLLAVATLLSLIGCGSRKTVTTHMVVAIDSAAIDAGSPQMMQNVIRVIGLRANQFGVAHPAFERNGRYQVSVTLPRVADPTRLARLISVRGELQFRLVDAAGAFAAALPIIDARLVRVGVVGRPSSRPAAPSLGSYVIITPDTAPRRGVPQATSAPLTALLFAGGTRGSFIVSEVDVARVDSLLRHPAARAVMPPGVDLLWAATPTKGSGTVDRALYAVQDGPILTGESVIDAQARDDDGVTLLFELSRRGGETFEAATARHLNDYLAFVLDGRVLTEPARIRGTIRQRGSVELGSVTLEDAKDVALILRTGALPAPINVLEMRSDTLP